LVFERRGVGVDLRHVVGLASVAVPRLVTRRYVGKILFGVDLLGINW
jgi:hypothetical protein